MGYQKQAAKICYEYGHEEEYVLYLKRHLAKSADVYLQLIEYYDSHNCTNEAIEIANEALDKYRDLKIMKSREYGRSTDTEQRLREKVIEFCCCETSTNLSYTDYFDGCRLQRQNS